MDSHSPVIVLESSLHIHGAPHKGFMSGHRVTVHNTAFVNHKSDCQDEVYHDIVDGELQ